MAYHEMLASFTSAVLRRAPSSLPTPVKETEIPVNVHHRADKANIETLPVELLVLIASITDASTAISLSRTSRSLRAAVYEPQVFRAIIRRSLVVDWESESLDHEALAARAGDNAHTWSRFAIANQRAARAIAIDPPEASNSGRKMPPVLMTAFTFPADYLPFLPDLALVKHPLIRQRGWRDFKFLPLKQQVPWLFTYLLAVLEVVHSRPDMGACVIGFVASINENGTQGFRRADFSLRFLFWGLCVDAVCLFTHTRTRARAWPFDAHALVPDIPLPCVERLPLAPLRDVNVPYELPAPFVRGCEKTSTTVWLAWYRAHCAALLDSPSFLWEGEWQGYYSHRKANFSDPPMVGIRFRRPQQKHGNQGAVQLEAESCRDGFGEFRLTGTVNRDPGTGYISLALRKIPTGDRPRSHWSSSYYEWDCRLTPVGITGLWGLYSPESMYEKLDRHGSLWLWKREWTKDPL